MKTLINTTIWYEPYDLMKRLPQAAVIHKSIRIHKQFWLENIFFLKLIVHFKYTYTSSAESDFSEPSFNIWKKSDPQFFVINNYSQTSLEVWY